MKHTSDDCLASASSRNIALNKFRYFMVFAVGDVAMTVKVWLAPKLLFLPNRHKLLAGLDSDTIIKKATLTSFIIS